ncbi:MAG: hypothetical protein ACRER7_00690, partial [Gammaproteobacteria bacterium]
MPASLYWNAPDLGKFTPAARKWTKDATIQAQGEEWWGGGGPLPHIHVPRDALASLPNGRSQRLTTKDGGNADFA